MKLEYMLKVRGEWERCVCVFVPCVCGNHVDNEAGPCDVKQQVKHAVMASGSSKVDVADRKFTIL